MSDFAELLAQAAALPDPAEAEAAAVAALRAELLERPDDVNRERLRGQVKRSKVMSLGLFDATAREAIGVARALAAAEAAEDDDDDPARPPLGSLMVPGSPGWAFIPPAAAEARAAAARPGECWVCARQFADVADMYTGEDTSGPRCTHPQLGPPRAADDPHSRAACAQRLEFDRSLKLCPEHGVAHADEVIHPRRPRDVAARPGAVFEQRGKAWRSVLPWCPRLERLLLEPDEAGDTITLHFDITAGADRTVAAAEQLGSGEVWQRLRVPGTGSRRVREVLANILLAQAADAPAGYALSYTGWHAADDGARFYVFADGRTSDGRRVALVHSDPAVALAAAPVDPDREGIPAALSVIAEHGRGPALAGLGIGARSLAQSLHKVLGGYLIVGLRNSGKSSAAWHGRLLLIARPGRVSAYPPVPSTTFTATPGSAEGSLNFEADMPALLDDGSLNANSSAVQVRLITERLEATFRPLANDTAVRPRSSRTLAPQRSRFVRSPVMATLQSLPEGMDPSLRRRALIMPVRRGDLDVKWYRAEAKGGAVTGLIRPVRTLGEHLLIPHLAALGDAAAAYVAGRDAEALELLAAELDSIAPGWAESDEGVEGVADIAAAALAGLLMVCDVVPAADRAALVGLACGYLARCVAEQSEQMSDESSADTSAQGVPEALRAALLAGRAHIRDSGGNARPAITWLTEQEQGLEKIGMGEWRGRGAPVYWLPDVPALGVSSEVMFGLLRSARDAPMPARTVRALPKALVAAGLALPKDGGPTWKLRVGSATPWLICLRPELFFPDPSSTGAPEAPEHPEHPEHPSSGGVPSAIAAELPLVSGTSQVNGLPALEGSRRVQTAQLSQTGSDLLGSGCSGYVPADSPVPWLAEVCAYIDDADAAGQTGKYAHSAEGAVRLITGGMRALAAADGDAIRAAYALATGAPAAVPAATAEAPAQAALSAPAAVPAQRPPDAGRAAPERPAEAAQGVEVPPARPGAPEALAGPRTAPAEGRRPSFLVLSLDGVAYGPEGSTVALPDNWVAKVRNVGDLAALALHLGMAGGTSALYVPREVREALRLPVSLPAVQSVTEGWPHQFTESTDPEVWDIWPAEPVGLAAWMQLYRRPTTFHEGAAVVFPEWLPEVGLAPLPPQLGGLPAAELAEALTLTWRATCYDGAGGRFGGVHYHRSPQATMRRLVRAVSRRRRAGQLEPVKLPPPYTPGSPVGRVTMPRDHAAPPLEVPAGWVLARADVRRCYASAALGTDFGVGQAQHYDRPGPEVLTLPGVHLVRAAPGAAVLHEALCPFLPERPARGQREVSAWLDTTAVRLLTDNGVAFTVAESWAWPEPAGRRVYDSALKRMLAALDELGAAGTRPALAASAVVKAMYSAFLGGDVASDYHGERSADDATHRRDHWVTVKTQAEVRSQRNLLVALRSPSPVLVLGASNTDAVFLAAPTLADIEAMPGTGKLSAAEGGGPRPAIWRPGMPGAGNGKLVVNAVAEVTPQLAELLAAPAAQAPRSETRRRIAALRAALAEEE